MVSSGATAAATALALGLSLGTVNGVWHRARTPRQVRPRRSYDGQLNPNAKLTPQQAAEIRRRRLGGEKLTALAAEFDVDQSLIHLIAKGKRWPTLDAGPLEDQRTATPGGQL